jgi:hypothetical protein
VQKNKNQILFPAIVIDNNDPLMLGRVRAITQLDNIQEIIQAVWSDALAVKKKTPENENDIPESYKWTIKDPFLALPLLPFFFNQQPQIDESVNIIHADKEYPLQNRYYVQGTFSSPVMSKNETYHSSRKHTTQGTSVKSLPNIKKPGTDEYYNKYSKGVYPEPIDNGLMGRGTCDIIVKENDVLIRAGRSFPQKPNQLPKYNNKRSFLQLSTFQSKEVNEGDKIFTKIITGTPQVRFLLEWSILNPDNQFNIFTGSVTLYQLKDDIERLKGVELTVNTTLNSSEITLITTRQFNNLSKEQATEFINTTIKELNDNSIIENSQGIRIKIQNPFPLCFRPNSLTYQWISTKDISVFPYEFNNITYFNEKIKLETSDTKSGFGILYTKSSFDKPAQITQERIVKKGTDLSSQTIGIMGGDKMVFLSHESTIPNKGKINIDDTVYGITQDLLNNEIIPKTNSMVRGEELMELLELIVQYLVTHVHPFPGLPPVPVGTTGIQSQELLDKLRNAADNILNKNIRIN